MCDTAGLLLQRNGGEDEHAVTEPCSGRAVALISSAGPNPNSGLKAGPEAGCAGCAIFLQYFWNITHRSEKEA